MATEIERMVAVLEARTDKFEKAMAKAAGVANTRASQIEKRFTKANPTASRAAAQSGQTLGLALIGGFAGGLAAGAVQQAISGFIGLVQSSFGDLAKLKDVADATGATTDQIQTLRYAASQSGGDFATADAALERFTNAVGDASRAEGFLYKLFKANGLAVTDSTGALRANGQVLADVANLIQNAASPQERFNIATEIFGRKAAPAMVNALADGAAGLNAFGREAQASGAILQKETIDKAAEIDDAWTKLVDSLSLRIKGMVVDSVAAFQTLSQNAVVAAKLTQGLPLTFEELAYAIELARSKGSPVDPAWLDQLEALKLKAQDTGAAIKAALAGIAAIDGIDTGTAAPAAAPAAAAPFPVSKPRGPTKLPYNYKADENEFTRAMEQSRKRTEALQLETSQLGKSTFEQEKARAELELTTAAKQAHLGMSDSLRAKIEAEAQAYAAASVALEDAQAAQHRWLDLQQQVGDLGVDSIQGLIEGTKSLNDVLNSSISLITQMLLKSVLLGQGPLAGLFGGSVANSNGIGGLVGSLFGGFRAGGGPVANGKSYVVGEKGPEVFTPGTSGTITPNSAVARGGGRVTMQMSINLSGANGDAAIARAAHQAAMAGAAAALKATPSVSLKAASDNQKRRG